MFLTLKTSSFPKGGSFVITSRIAPLITFSFNALTKSSSVMILPLYVFIK